EMVEIITKEVNSLGAEVNINVQNLCKAVNIPENSETVEVAKKALKTIGFDAKTTFMTGFTDASIYNNKGIEVAVVGIGAQLEHSTEEFIKIADMEKASKMIVEILRLSSE
ncbi:MAG: M20/M25/M40 family metallo-hydrolase, partial [Melioribacteraceae bacterium]|nr:M20/M25/M40 family metallo-hydrolase [Melioribacteraceae bacterium]